MSDKRKILVVEDDDRILTLLKYNLDRENFDVTTARDGIEGLEAIKAQRPDLVISDVMMPRMDGFSFCKALRKDPDTQGIPFIFLTARGQLPDKIEGLQDGADDYLTKPFDPRELMEMVNARMARTEVYKKIADTDGLTKLINRRALMDRLWREFKNLSPDKRISVGFIDVDLFRKVNERFGHPAGDEALVAIANVLREISVKSGFAGRYGGEEFLVVLPGKDRKKAGPVLEDIRSSVEKLTFSQKDLKVTISAGIAGYPEDGKDPESLIAAADKALFRAKQTGSNRVVMFSEMEGGRNNAG